MDKKLLISSCGLDCFNCPIYKENITEKGKSFFSAALDVHPEKTPCNGCREEKGHCKFSNGEECETWKCSQEKGVQYCYECGDFPCDKLMPSQAGAAFPHNMKVYNLCRMKRDGLDSWIAEAAENRKRYYDGVFCAGKGPVIKE